MISQEENDLICRVGPGKPLTKLAKTFWLPAYRSDSVEAGGKPERIELLGEKYIAWRAEDGKLGFFEEACPHRRASLALARNEDCALTCIYHGWTFGPDGKILDIPSEPEANRERLKAHVKLRHFAHKEVNGVIWVFLGNQDEIPPFPEFEFNTLKEPQVLALRGIVRANWLQVFEAALDSAHLNFLHNGHLEDVGQNVEEWKLMQDAAPRFEMEKTPYGFKEAAIRDLSDGSTYLRLRHAALPFFSLVAFEPHAPQVVVASIPINDESCVQWLFTFTTEESIFKLLSAGKKDGEESPMFPNLNNISEGVGSVENLWNQDREFMKTHWSGIRGPLPWEDIVVTESMGPIVDRTKENLASTDIIIIKTRRFICDMIRANETGEEPQTIGYNIDNLSDLRGVAIRFSRDVDWKTIDGKNPPKSG